MLLGDYNLKIARQCYHLSKQERIISLLVSQYVRHKLLSVQLINEKTSQMNVNDLVTGITTEFEQLAYSQEARMVKKYRNFFEFS